jgi:hypothetical protein
VREAVRNRWKSWAAAGRDAADHQSVWANEQDATSGLLNCIADGAYARSRRRIDRRAVARRVGVRSQRTAVAQRRIQGVLVADHVRQVSADQLEPGRCPDTEVRSVLRAR